MAKIPKSSGVQGAWIDKSQLKTGQRAKFVSEAEEKPSNFPDKDGGTANQVVVKARFEGMNEVFNVALNKTTTNGLNDAFGDDSVNWQGKYLTLKVEEGRYGGKKSYSIYFIPEGFEMKDDENGFAVIVKKGTEPKPTVTEPPIVEEDEEEKVNPADLPF